MRKAGHYFTNHVSEFSPTECEAFPSAMCELFLYASMEQAKQIFKEEPTLIGLSNTEKRSILNFRQLVLEKILQER